MSGFLGVFGGDPALHAPDVIEAAAARLAPRSPDGLSAAHAGPATLVQGLLRLYRGDDTSPVVHSLGDRFWLAGDIRLDDRDQLRTRLRAVLGPTDHLESDADLVLQAYRAWSHRCTEHLLGDFSFVLWDAAAGEAGVDPEDAE